ncbi:MAG TPA: hypothetical protein VI260_01770 [Blastocatellia bacterium]|jgi:hypothetical protein
MQTLSNPKLKVELISGTSNVHVTATVNVSFNEFEKNLIKLLGLKFRLRCRLRGSDGLFKGPDDDLFLFPNKTIIADGTSTFTATMNRNVLDEDDIDNDEVYAHFILQSMQALFPFTRSKDSLKITSNF